MKKPPSVVIIEILVRRFAPSPHHTFANLDPNSRAMFESLAKDIIEGLPKEGYRIVESILQ